MSLQKYAALAVVALLSGCVGTTQEVSHSPAPEASLSSMRAMVFDRTVLTHGPHGTQVEYHAPSGRAHLWYPGNRRGVPSNWKVVEDGSGFGICWRYPVTSRNGITGEAGGQFECTPMKSYLPGIVEILEGDPFNLNGGGVPFPLPRGLKRAAELAATAGIDPDSLKYTYGNQ